MALSALPPICHGAVDAAAYAYAAYATLMLPPAYATLTPRYMPLSPRSARTIDCCCQSAVVMPARDDDAQRAAREEVATTSATRLMRARCRYARRMP